MGWGIWRHGRHTCTPAAAASDRHPPHVHRLAACRMTLVYIDVRCTAVLMYRCTACRYDKVIDIPNSMTVLPEV